MQIIQAKNSQYEYSLWGTHFAVSKSWHQSGAKTVVFYEHEHCSRIFSPKHDVSKCLIVTHSEIGCKSAAINKSQCGFKYVP